MVSVGPVEVDEICLADLCRQYQVRELALFGSAARGEARADTDIDLRVEFLPEAHIGLMDYAGPIAGSCEAAWPQGGFGF